MGDDLIPYEIGDSCVNCNNILYNPDETPKYIEVTLTGIKGCYWFLPFPDMPNGTFILKQGVGSPCSYSYQDLNFRVTYSIPHDGSNVHAWVWSRPVTGAPIPAWQRCFSGTFAGLCKSYFENRYICDDYRNFGHSGYARVFIPTGQNVAYYMALLLGIEHYQDMKSEHWWYDFSLANTCVVLLARQPDHTNVLVKWDRSHYDQDIMTES